VVELVAAFSELRLGRAGAVLRKLVGGWATERALGTDNRGAGGVAISSLVRSCLTGTGVGASFDLNRSTLAGAGEV